MFSKRVLNKFSSLKKDTQYLEKSLQHYQKLHQTTKQQTSDFKIQFQQSLEREVEYNNICKKLLKQIKAINATEESEETSHRFQ